MKNKSVYNLLVMNEKMQDFLRERRNKIGKRSKIAGLQNQNCKSPAS